MAHCGKLDSWYPYEPSKRPTVIKDKLLLSSCHQWLVIQYSKLESQLCLPYQLFRANDRIQTRKQVSSFNLWLVVMQCKQLKRLISSLLTSWAPTVIKGKLLLENYEQWYSRRMARSWELDTCTQGCYLAELIPTEPLIPKYKNKRFIFSSSQSSVWH